MIYVFVVYGCKQVIETDVISFSLVIINRHNKEKILINILSESIYSRFFPVYRVFCQEELIRLDLNYLSFYAERFKTIEKKRQKAEGNSEELTDYDIKLVLIFFHPMYT